jgi:adenylate cyclase class 2
MEEIEVKFLDIDVPQIEEKLTSLGAEKVGEYFYRRQIFDYPGFTLNEKAAWLRLRDEGEQVTLSFKQRLGTDAHDGSTSDKGMKEVEIVVNDFGKTSQLLHDIGLIDKFYQENKRVRWAKDGIEFDIDTWPRLNPYLEIEAKSWEEIDKAIAWLGLNPADKKIFSTNQIYKSVGINELDYTFMSFDRFEKRK